MQKKKKENKFLNFVGILLIIICIPILLAFVTIAIKANINHNKLPDFLGYKPLICASNSMSNIFELGDLTITKQVLEKELNKGDIITFWDAKHNIVITHRIEDITLNENGKKEYITKGDMNNDTDKEKVRIRANRRKMYMLCKIHRKVNTSIAKANRTNNSILNTSNNICKHI